MLDVAVVDDPTRDWTEPGVYTVAPGVYRIPLPLPTDGLRAVNVYAVLDGDDLVLIDSGWAIAEAKDALAAGLAGIDKTIADVRRFLVTHVHRDHYTQAVVLRREFGTEIALGKGEQPTLDRIGKMVAEERRGRPPFIGRLSEAGATELVKQLSAMTRPPDSDRDVWESPDVWLADQATANVGTRELTATLTPGHTRGHMVFTESATGLMFAGDHVLPHITPSIGFEGAPVDFPLRDYLASLKLVRGMPDARLLPAHGPVAPSVHARVDELLAHHDRRLALIGDLVDKGASTAFEAATRMTWTRRERTLSELDSFNQMLAILETMSHLDVLMLQGRLSRTDGDGVHHYRAR
ncbi:MAG TPA: MBL fold metallo-hydrolase [Pseudonocardiaceae bacterium]|nr:MBL fold metallo-hydrolase [Pseudonocardiaceae bacterium]